MSEALRISDPDQTAGMPGFDGGEMPAFGDQQETSFGTAPGVGEAPADDAGQDAGAEDPTIRERLKTAWDDPERGGRLRAVASAIGVEAIKGAVEATGLGKRTDDGWKLSRIKAATTVVRAFASPMTTGADLLRKAGTGAVTGAKAAASTQARNAYQKFVDNSN
jgi:hypothetical protein